ncbi:MAG: recombination protein NinG [Candidatus Peribacteria bacterium]|nr:recombination protein NinG [Candidatus Peribacteria bacterium]
MHFITRSCMRYRRDEDNCHAGCMRCNVFLNGNYIIYTRRMQRKYGIEKIDEMITKKNDVFKIHTSEIKEKIEYYKTKINELQPSL